MDILSGALVPILFVMFGGLALLDQNQDDESADEAEPTDDILDGSQGEDDLLDGADGNDTLTGNEGDGDTLNAGDGDDILNVLGENTASGGAGADEFNVDATLGGQSTIVDFDPAEDSLILTVPAEDGGLEVVSDGDDLVLKGPGEDGTVYTTLSDLGSLEGAVVTLEIPAVEASEEEAGSPALVLELSDLAAGDLVEATYDAASGWTIDPGESGAGVEITEGVGTVADVVEPDEEEEPEEEPDVVDPGEEPDEEEPDESDAVELVSGDVVNATEDPDSYVLTSYGEGSTALIRGFDPNFDSLQIVLPEGGEGDLTLTTTVVGDTQVWVDGVAAIQIGGMPADLLGAITAVPAG
ncbi:hypothetical protein IV417_11120 [Alphaproteobacteria bacterium KMM 3653]|uniref:Uncharacterized protein n=1 Tax=Harenicola maris TaxID=2841044 RepID=A0AAP2G4I3_9RHOB|nr:hypothetical protein [Harenicola maris]